MSQRADYLEGLLDLVAYRDKQARRAVFRQSVASLALAASVDGPSPLDGIRPEALLASVRLAIADGLLDDLSWLAEAPAAVVLYELAASLPLGPERRELGRRVLGQMYAGNAATFVATVTRIAAGSARGLGGAGIRARVTLAMSLPSTVEVPVDALALSLASRRELARDWIVSPSTGSLPERRLAGRLLERSAREAVRRSMQGDQNPIRLFRSAIAALSSPRRSPAHAQDPSPIAAVMERLLADRETLVWKHLAAARGLLAGASPDLAAAITADFAADLRPTAWRRAATSLVASIAIDPDRALPRSMDLLRGPLLSRDPAIATAMVWGLRCAAELEPEAAEELLSAITLAAPIPVAESVAELRNELGSFGARAAEQCARALSTLLGAPEPDDGLAALARSILRDLSSAPGEGSELSSAIRRAVTSFVETGTREAHAQALEALSLATETVAALEALEVSDEPSAQASLSRRAAAALLRELDVHMLESGLLKALLLLDRAPSDESGGVAAVDDLEERLSTWLLRTESPPQHQEKEGAAAPGGAEPSTITAGPPLHVTLHQRQLRALLHLIDGDAADAGDDGDRRSRVRHRWSSACHVLLARLGIERAIPLRRSFAATVARALDALVRDGAADAADVLLCVAARVEDAHDLEVFAEASMHPDVTQLVRLYARFTRKVHEPGSPPPSGGPSSVSWRGERGVAALDALVTDLPAGATPRIEVLRGALSRLVIGLTAVRGSASLNALTTATDGGQSPLVALAEAVGKLAVLTTTARLRCGADIDEEAPRLSEPPNPWAGHSDTSGSSALPAGRISQSAIRAEGQQLVALRRALQRSADASAPELAEPIEEDIEAIRRVLPRAIAGVIAEVVPAIASYPMDRPSAPTMRSVQEQALPAWLPPRRTLGGFYVVRQLGGGSLGTVFVVTRAEERHDTDAERFALKVPDYDATAARSVSEADFLKLFREEAGALLSLPEHKNIARFVTFDAGARPKPILVMELVEGIRCDHLIASGKLTIPLVLSILDGVLDGLAAMHEVGVGHLDIKPSNVVLRGGTEPVLVDFGLAGRHIRPGCATAAYGAPEVWGAVPSGTPATAMTADVYSFGCLAYEVITGQTLFDDPSDIATVSAHLMHDGLPPPIRKMSETPRLEPLAMFLFHCLRQVPNSRKTASELRKDLAALPGKLAWAKWPIAPG